MANELNIALAKSGLTVTAQPYQAGAAVGSAISCPEIGSTGFYSGNMTGSAGTYQLAFIASSANVGSGSIVWDGTAEVASSAPTAVQIRTEMDSNSTKLANLDAAVSSRLAPSGTLAVVTTLTNAPTVPSAATIASQVRSELSVELARVDQAISTRATPGDIPTESEIAAEVWAKPTTELTITGSIGERAKNQSTVSTTGAQLAAALS